MFGPTTSDRVRLADTDLIIEVEKDLCTYGEGEIRRRQGDPRWHGPGQVIIQGAVDTVITNALILDHWGLRPMSASGRPHRRHRQGRQSGHPARRHHHRPGTEAIAARAKLTAGGFDTHIHFICPQRVKALMSGVTSMLGGGTGPRRAPTRPPARPARGISRA
jgi:urease subunit alpha